MADRPRLKDYYNDNRFWSLFVRHRKWKEFFCYKEGWISIGVGIVFALCTSHFSVDKTFASRFEAILTTICGGQFTLLGFIIGSLAIVSGTLQNKIVRNIDKAQRAGSLMSILTNFYFAGVVLAMAIFYDIFFLLAQSWLFGLQRYWMFLSLFLFWYLLIFSVIYSTMLIGTSLRMFLSAYFYYDDGSPDADG